MRHLSENFQLDVLPMDCSSTTIPVLFPTLSPFGVTQHQQPLHSKA